MITIGETRIYLKERLEKIQDCLTIKYHKYDTTADMYMRETYLRDISYLQGAITAIKATLDFLNT